MPGEQAVQLGLVGDLDGEGGGGVVVANEAVTAEPVRPVVVEVAGEPDLVGGGRVPAPGGGGRGRSWRCSLPGAPTVAVRAMARRRWRLPVDRRMAHSATARLMTQPAPLARSPWQLAGAEDGVADALGEHLGAGGQRDGVGADHPGAVGGDVAAADGGEPEDQAGGHRGAEAPGAARRAGHRCRAAARRTSVIHSAEPATISPATVRTRPARRCQPGAGGGTGARTGTRRPGRRRRRRRCGRTSGEREAGEPVVGRHDRGAAGELDQPQRAGRQRDGGQRDQGGRDRPATWPVPELRCCPSRQAHRGGRVLGAHRTATCSPAAVCGAGAAVRSAGRATGRRRGR